MKYAVALPADQTIVYLTGIGRGETTKHPEAKLWDRFEDAVFALAEVNSFLDEDQLLSVDWIEAVEDEAEFRAREDTW